MNIDEHPDREAEVVALRVALAALNAALVAHTEVVANPAMKTAELLASADTVRASAIAYSRAHFELSDTTGPFMDIVRAEAEDDYPFEDMEMVPAEVHAPGNTSVVVQQTAWFSVMDEDALVAEGRRIALEHGHDDSISVSPAHAVASILHDTALNMNEVFGPHGIRPVEGVSHIWVADEDVASLDVDELISTVDPAFVQGDYWAVPSNDDDQEPAT